MGVIGLTIQDYPISILIIGKFVQDIIHDYKFKVIWYTKAFIVETFGQISIQLTELLHEEGELDLLRSTSAQRFSRS